MDLVTHGLASFALARGLFPRAGKLAAAAAVLAGCLADADRLAMYFGPSAAFTWRGTYFHSVLAAVLLSALVAVIFGATSQGKHLNASTPAPGEPESNNAFPAKKSSAAFFLLFAALVAALLHLAMDVCQSDGVMLLWPFRAKQFAADWLPEIDPWILTILVLAVAVPELLSLVSSEIGVKSKKPRGQTGALIGLALVVIYIGARGTLHANAVGLLESRVFHGEAARRALAYPEALSLTTWHGVAETESALDQIDVNFASSGTFDPDASLRVFKPESSAALEAAQDTPIAKQFLAVAQMPKASVEKTDVGSVVILRDLRYAASGETQHEIAALIELDPDNKVTSQEIVWARDLRGAM